MSDIKELVSVRVLTKHRYTVLKPVFFAVALVGARDAERDKTVFALRPRRLDDSFAVIIVFFFAHLKIGLCFYR